MKCREVHRAMCDKVHPDSKSSPGICRVRVQSQQCSSENKSLPTQLLPNLSSKITCFEMT